MNVCNNIVIVWSLDGEAKQLNVAMRKSKPI